jgi:hypothetical protein
MQILTVEVAQDHIDRLAKAKKPICGLAELIWNSVDADATEPSAAIAGNSFLATSWRAGPEIQVVVEGDGMVALVAEAELHLHCALNDGRVDQ